MIQDTSDRLIPIAKQAALARSFKIAHTIDDENQNTLLIINICNPDNVKTILDEAKKYNKDNNKRPPIQAFATASYGMALVAGTTDDEMKWSENGPLSIAIGKEVYNQTKDSLEGPIPFSVDIQEGYLDQLDTVVEDIILKAGAVGLNLEDSFRPDSTNQTPKSSSQSQLMPVEMAVQRIERVILLAKRMGLNDFVVNARSDAVLCGGTVEEAIERGELYLKAGATNVFVLGGSSRGLRTEEVKELAKGLNGKLSVGLKPNDGLSLNELSNLGIARASLGPQLYFKHVQGGDDLLRKSVRNLWNLGRIDDQ